MRDDKRRRAPCKNNYHIRTRCSGGKYMASPSFTPNAL
jgi:hypothetical protein